MNNNPRFDPSPDSQSADSLRSDIDTTRQRMDQTIDALTSRLKGRHLMDEVIGFFRRTSSTGNGAKLREKATESAGSALHTAVDTIKAHPLPTLLIGAGVGWLLYEKSHRSSGDSGGEYDPDYDARLEAGYVAGWEDDVPYDYAPSEYAEAGSGLPGSDDFYEESGPSSSESSPGLGKEGMKERLRGKAAAARRRSRASAHLAAERLNTGYDATRRRVASTLEERPLEAGIACLALGVIVGLLTPVPNAVSERARPTANRLRRRAREAGREWVDRGKHVAEAALEAARSEAERQGLTPEQLRQKIGSVADHARGAAKETAHEEGLDPSSRQGSPSSPSGTPSTAANPASNIP